MIKCILFILDFKIFRSQIFAQVFCAFNEYLALKVSICACRDLHLQAPPFNPRDIWNPHRLYNTNSKVQTEYSTVPSTEYSAVLYLALYSVLYL